MYKHDLDWVLEAARSSAKDRSTEWAIDEIRWAHGCVEPGYPDQPVMMANCGFSPERAETFRRTDSFRGSS